MRTSSPERKPLVLFVGAFPPASRRIFGGMVSSCAALMASSFPERVDLLLVDTTQQQVPPPPVAVRAAYALRRVAKVLWLIERRRPDAVLMFAALGLSFLEKTLCAAYARFRGIPVLLSLRGGGFMQDCERSPAYRRLAGFLLRGPTFLVCQGESWQAFFRDTFGIPEERAPVVRNWTASGDLLRLGEEREYGPAHGPVRLLFVGWLDAEKGVLELLEAFGRLAAEPGAPAMELRLAGEGNASGAAREWVGARGLGERVTFLGWVSGEEKLRALREADVFVLPSHAEGLPNAMVEAMAAGLPVVVTPVGSIPDVVRDGEQGLLVAPRDVDALAGALRSLAGDPAARERMGREAHRTARRDFGAEAAAEQLAGLVHRACRREAAVRTGPGAGGEGDDLRLRSFTTQEHP